MYYAMIGFLALCVLVIANHDILLKRAGKSGSAVQRIYYLFLLSVIAYYVTDILWGILDALSLTYLLYADTVIYYLAMASGIVFWTRYVFAYLNEKNRFGTILLYAGSVFGVIMLVMLVVNFFTPVMFWFDETGAYHAGPLRHAMLIVQVVMFLLVSIHTLRVAISSRDSGRGRFLVISLFGFIMASLLSVQLFFPLLPLYSIGYMLGCCLLRTFVIEDERSAYQKKLEKSLVREKLQREELSSAWKLAYTDALTGVKSKLAYAEKEEQIDRAISNNTLNEFAVAVFDVNGLKTINDVRGHDMGDRYICDAAVLICRSFGHSPVFRVGGDEFAAVLTGEDYVNRAALIASFNRRIEDNLLRGKVTVAAGIADYIPGSDECCEQVFKRADKEMYCRKEEMKSRRAVG